MEAYVRLRASKGRSFRAMVVNWRNLASHQPSKSDNGNAIVTVAPIVTRIAVNAAGASCAKGRRNVNEPIEQISGMCNR